MQDCWKGIQCSNTIDASRAYVQLKHRLVGRHIRYRQHTMSPPPKRTPGTVWEEVLQPQVAMCYGGYQESQLRQQQLHRKHTELRRLLGVASNMYGSTWIVSIMSPRSSIGTSRNTAGSSPPRPKPSATVVPAFQATGATPQRWRFVCLLVLLGSDQSLVQAVTSKREHTGPAGLQNWRAFHSHARKVQGLTYAARRRWPFPSEELHACFIALSEACYLTTAQCS